VVWKLKGVKKRRKNVLSRCAQATLTVVYLLLLLLSSFFIPIFLTPFFLCGSLSFFFFFYSTASVSRMMLLVSFRATNRAKNSSTQPLLLPEWNVHHAAFTSRGLCALESISLALSALLVTIRRFYYYIIIFF
jgi:hypothetical protein